MKGDEKYNMVNIQSTTLIDQSLLKLLELKFILTKNEIFVVCFRTEFSAELRSIIL